MSIPCHGHPSVCAYIRARALELPPGGECIIDPFELPCPWGSKVNDVPSQARAYVALTLLRINHHRGRFACHISQPERWIRIERLTTEETF
jgi:hypothetical protein